MGFPYFYLSPTFPQSSSHGSGLGTRRAEFRFCSDTHRSVTWTVVSPLMRTTATTSWAYCGDEGAVIHVKLWAQCLALGVCVYFFNLVCVADTVSVLCILRFFLTGSCCSVVEH